MKIECTVEELFKIVLGKEIKLETTNAVNKVEEQQKISREQLKRLFEEKKTPVAGTTDVNNN